jgi:hypothetical protein
LVAKQGEIYLIFQYSTEFDTISVILANLALALSIVGIVGGEEVADIYCE